jgi:hypothetical protein
METERSQHAKSIGHEPLETNVRAVSQTGAGLAAVVVVAFVLVYGMMKLYSAAEGVSPGEPVSKQVPMPADTPRLDPDQPVELRALRERESQMLDSYGWVDRAAGVARIPIERAMQVIAEKGLPETPPAAADAPLPAESNQP